jgi:flagellar biosynthesis protein FliP
MHGTHTSMKCTAALLVILASALSFVPDACAADPGALFRMDLQPGENPGTLSVTLQIFLLLTVLSLAPSILIMVTCFTRIAIVLSLLRQAIGSNQLPPNQIIIGLSLFLTVFIMTPVWQTVNQQALQPYLANQLTSAEALGKAEGPVRAFMLKHTREKDLALLVDVAKIPRPNNVDEVPTTVLIPAFIISELKTAFQIGFMLYIPFLIIDMVVASVLLSMGMMMLPPVMVSLPFKLMIFVLTDGWHLIVGSLVKSFSV